jgi:hypothetical protein
MSIHIEPQKSGNGRPNAEIHSSSPEPRLWDFADVALIDAAKCAAIGDMSLAWWFREVHLGHAPAPAIRKPRCTRWKAADVRNFWRRFAEQGDDPQVIVKATKASAAAKAKRAAHPASGEAAQ